MNTGRMTRAVSRNVISGWDDRTRVRIGAVDLAHLAGGRGDRPVPEEPRLERAGTGAAGPGPRRGWCSRWERHADGPVRASALKRAILRKDPTFDEADQGFRGFGELLRNLEGRRVIELRPGSAQGDPEVSFPEHGSAEDEAFRLLVEVVREQQASGSPPHLSGLKNQLRKRRPDFSEKRYGFNNFLSFVKAARTNDLIAMRWDEAAGDYVLRLPAPG